MKAYRVTEERFDDPNLVAHAGLEPPLRLADESGLREALGVSSPAPRIRPPNTVIARPAARTPSTSTHGSFTNGIAPGTTGEATTTPNTTQHKQRGIFQVPPYAASEDCLHSGGLALG